MNRRDTILATNEIYHIYNRSIAKEQIFINKFTLRHICELVDYYRFRQEVRYSKYRVMNEETKETYYIQMRNKIPLVEVYVYAFMPNHYHFLLKQIQDNGIKTFISNLQNSYAKYYNLKFDRTGSLFQSPFKARWIENDEDFMHVSRYAHLNPVTLYIVNLDQLKDYPYTSFPVYCGEKKNDWLNTALLLGLFGTGNKYYKFVSDQVDYQRSLDKIRDLLLE